MIATKNMKQMVNWQRTEGCMNCTDKEVENSAQDMRMQCSLNINKPTVTLSLSFLAGLDSVNMSVNKECVRGMYFKSL